MVIGRTHGCDIMLAEEDVSRRHARVTVHDDGRVEVTDLGSSNGLLLQGKRVPSAFLTDGARIGIGRATLALLWMDDVDALLEKNQGVVGRGNAGLLSRRYFLDALAWELEHPGEAGVTVVACFTIDDLAAKRDARGMGTAETYVQRVASAIASAIQDPELPIGRTAEDELSVVFQADSLESANMAASLAARSAAVLAPITLSVGLAAASPRSKPATVFAAAQRALLLARASGGAQVRVAP